MNNLSWFIYLVQLVDALTVVMVWCAIIVIVLFVAKTIITAIKGEIAHDNCEDGWKAKCAARRAVWEAWKPAIGKHAALFLLCIALAQAIPSRQTMILVAGSELGERVMNSAAVSDGMNLVKLWIQQETDKLKKAATK